MVGCCCSSLGADHKILQKHDDANGQRPPGDNHLDSQNQRTATPDRDDDDSYSTSLPRTLVEWLRSKKDGFFHHSLDIRAANIHHSHSASFFSSSGSIRPFVLVAQNNIPAETVLLNIPFDSIIPSGSMSVGDSVRTDLGYEANITAIVVDDAAGSDGSGATTAIRYQLTFEDGEVHDDFARHEFQWNTDEAGVNCGTVWNVLEKLWPPTNNQHEPEDAEMAPFLHYLQSSLLSLEQTSQLRSSPHAWSEAGRTLFRVGVLGQRSRSDIGNMRRHSGIPPYQLADDWIQEHWVHRCHGTSATAKDSERAEQVFWLVQQFGWEEGMIPFFDMMQHRNGPWLNAEKQRRPDGSSLQVRAIRDITAGEPIYISFNLCKECFQRQTIYGTPQMFADYGWVEDYPQRWIFPGHAVDFEIDQIMETNQDGSLSQTYRVQWLLEMQSPDEDRNIAWLEAHLDRVRRLPHTLLATRDPEVPTQEWNRIVTYHRNLMVALSHAIQSARHGGSTTNATVAAVVAELDDPSTCLWPNETDNSCLSSATFPTYDRLEWKDEVWESTYSDTCDPSLTSFVKRWTSLEIKRSHYQEMEFYYNPVLHDICFDLDSTIQQCASYRPHYHETMVHQAARYIENVRRVVFVGGGDSMLLHEILKYESLELVVGLELDQQVTRNSFKYFGTQPHWDNPKVEWWYGDATKSLLMLPKEYFGSFDLVLVDLSETVVSLTVTRDLDVMEALMLLVKPEGVLVKNEYRYFGELSKLFEYTAHLYYNKINFICGQDMIMGSNKVDFLRSNTYHHPVNFLYDMVHPEKGDTKVIRDYQKNVTSSKKFCLREQVESARQESSSGILMIVEAEQVTAQIESSDVLKQLLTKAAQREGFTILDGNVSSLHHGSLPQVALVLAEGYVVARFWPQHSYIAFDIHLWSRFDKHTDLEKSLLETVGSSVSSPSSSSYRIVAGGMFGTSTWVDDEKKKGPQGRKDCKDVPGSMGNKPANVEKTASALEASMMLINDEDCLVVVLCGEKSQPCLSVEILNSLSQVRAVVPIWSCPSLETDEIAPHDHFACEQETLEHIKTQVPQGGSIRAIIVDSSATRGITQVAYNIFSNPLNVLRWLKGDVVVSAILLDQSETWRRAFVHKFRQEIVPDEPAFSGLILCNSSESSFELSVMSAGEVLFIDRLKAVADSIESRSGLNADIQSVRAGFYAYDGILRFNKTFTTHDYDQASPLKQWNTQQPLGFQTVFQLSDGKLATPLSTEIILKALKRSLKAAVKSANDVSSIVPELREATQVGEGTVIFGLWPGGSVVAVWDGRKHVDVNLFTYTESWAFAEAFLDKFTDATRLDTVLRDEQPRGIGHVVNFQNDIEPRAEPFWAKDFEEYNRHLKGPVGMDEEDNAEEEREDNDEEEDDEDEDDDDDDDDDQDESDDESANEEE